MIVSTAAHSWFESCETVGSFNAGRHSMTAAKLSFATFIFSPTFSSAASAPRMSRARSSIFCRFHGSSQAALLAISFVVDSKRTSTILSPLARRVLPVSVPSITASTRLGHFASVAPHENSTFASTPWSAR